MDTYALVFFPGIKSDAINSFRKKYDPQSSLIEPHLTLIFPVKLSFSEKELTDHITKVTKDWKSFGIEIKGLKLSHDNVLFLLVRKGNSALMKLHDPLYSGILSEFLRKGIEYIPHISIGANPDETALKEAKKLDLGYSCIVDKLTLVKITDGGKACSVTMEFSLK